MVDYFTTTNGVFDRIKAAGLKLTVNAYGEKYNLEMSIRPIKVVFNHNFSSFSSSSFFLWQRVYCQNNNAASVIATNEAAVTSGSIDRRKHAAVIYNVSGSLSIEFTKVTARVNVDEVFVTEFEVTRQPHYFKDYVTVLDNIERF